MTCPNCERVQNNAWATVQGYYLDVTTITTNAMQEVRDLQSEKDQLQKEIETWRNMGGEVS